MKKSISDTLGQTYPWTIPWPETNLEKVDLCPVCCSPDHGILYSDVIDNTFFTASGRWTIMSCFFCRTAFLSPRPTANSIANAYESYYTHRGGQGQIESTKLNLFRRLRRLFANGYINQRYGTKRTPELKLHSLLTNLLPIKSVLDAQFRYLPKPLNGQKLLDVGCGNGDFLINAKEMGWDASGLEPDVAAVSVARDRGLNIYKGTINDLEDISNYYDAVTISHVIEHVHQPREFLSSIYKILKYNGLIYIDTPNIQSFGAKNFGKNWRGIESPRHLTLFNPNSLKSLLLSSGFHNIQFIRRTDVQHGMFLSSKKISDLFTQKQTKNLSSLNFDNIFNYIATKTDNLEFITLIARKKPF